MKLFSVILAISIPLLGNPKVLHLTFHRGCEKEFDFVAQELGFDLETQFVPDLPIEKFDGETNGSARYNIGHRRAERVWEINRDYYDQFDLIVTSDTAPLSRIFLQNNFKKPLIVWVCNRFDYCDKRSLDCKFPDREYYNLIASANSRRNVKIISYTPFEHRYAEKVRKISAWKETIRPSGGGSDHIGDNSPIPGEIVRTETFFVPPYHNDTNLMNLSAKLTSLGIPNYRGRYAGPGDLKEFKGIIHIPYAWSNLALFENWANGLVYFIPSKKFLIQLSKSKRFFWTPPFRKDYLEDSDWYNPEFKELFVYFDSWEELERKVASTDYELMRFRIKEHAKKHKEQVLTKWKDAVEGLVDRI